MTRISEIPTTTTFLDDNQQTQYQEQQKQQQQQQLELIQYVLQCQQDPECDVVQYIPENKSYHHQQSSSSRTHEELQDDEGEEEQQQEPFQHPNPDDNPNCTKNTDHDGKDDDRIIQNTETTTASDVNPTSTHHDNNNNNNNTDTTSKSYHVVLDPFFESISYLGDSIVDDCDILIMKSCCWLNNDRDPSSIQQQPQHHQQQQQQQHVYRNELLTTTSCPMSPLSPTRSTTTTTTAASISVHLHQSPKDEENYHYVTDDDDIYFATAVSPTGPSSSAMLYHDESNFGLYNTTIVINQTTEDDDDDNCSIFSRHTTTPLDNQQHYTTSGLVRSSDDSISSSQSVQTIPLSSCHDKSYCRYDTSSTTMDGYSSGSSKEPNDNDNDDDDDDDDDDSFTMRSILLRMKIEDEPIATTSAALDKSSSSNNIPTVDSSDDESDQLQQHRSATGSLNSNSSSVDSFLLSKWNRRKNHTSPTSIIQWLSLKDTTNTIDQSRMHDIDADHGVKNVSYPLYPKQESNPCYITPAPPPQQQQPSLFEPSMEGDKTNYNEHPMQQQQQRRRQPYNEQPQQSTINNTITGYYNNNNSEIENHYRCNNNTNLKKDEAVVVAYRSSSYDNSSNNPVIDNIRSTNDRVVLFTMATTTTAAAEANVTTITIPIRSSSSSNHSNGGGCEPGYFSTTSSLTGNITDGSSIFDFSSVDCDDDFDNNNNNNNNNEFKIDSTTDPTNISHLNLSLDPNNTLTSEYITSASMEEENVLLTATTTESFSIGKQTVNNTYDDEEEEDDDENNCLFGLCFITDDATCGKMRNNARGSNVINNNTEKNAEHPSNGDNKLPILSNKDTVQEENVYVEISRRTSNSSVVDIDIGNNNDNNLENDSRCDIKGTEDTFCYETPNTATEHNLVYPSSPYSRTYLRRFCFETNDCDTDDDSSTTYECFSDEGSYDKKNKPTTDNYTNYDTACRTTIPYRQHIVCNDTDHLKGYRPFCFQQSLSDLNHNAHNNDGINTSTNTHVWPFDEGDEEDKKEDLDDYCYRQLQNNIVANENHHKNKQQNFKQSCPTDPQSNEYKSLTVPNLMMDVSSNKKDTTNKDDDETKYHRTSKLWHLPFRPISKFHKRMMARSRNGERVMK